MDMQGQRALPVSQSLTWDALNNPEVLKACIPGCDRFETDGPTIYNVGVTLKIGPVAAKFAGKVSLLGLAFWQLGLRHETQHARRGARRPRRDHGECRDDQRGQRAADDNHSGEHSDGSCERHRSACLNAASPCS